MGDLDFFEGSIAILSRIPLSKVRQIIHDGEDRTRRELFNKAKLPGELQPAFAAAIDVAHETQYDGGANDLERFRRRMIERIITNFEDPDRAMGDENIEYLMARLSQIDHGFALSS